MTTSVRAPLETTVGYPADLAARYRDAGYWTDETFQQFLGARAEQFGDAIAVTGPDASGVDRSLTYRQLSDRADRLAAGLRRSGVAPGDRVVVQLPNAAEFFEVIFALFRLGALPVFALPAHRAPRSRYFCALTEAAAYVITDVHDGFDYRTLAAEVARRRRAASRHRRRRRPGEHTALAELCAATRPACRPGPARAGDLAFLQLSGGSTGHAEADPAHPRRLPLQRPGQRRDLRPRPRTASTSPCCRWRTTSR